MPLELLATWGQGMWKVYQRKCADQENDGRETCEAMPAGTGEAAHSVATCAVGAAVVCPSDALVDVNITLWSFKPALQRLQQHADQTIKMLGHLNSNMHR